MGFLWKRRAKAPPLDPLATFDGVIAALERQAGEVRRSAATLLAFRAELEREVAKQRDRLRAFEARLAEAERLGDDTAMATLGGDRDEARRRITEGEASLEGVASDARLLKETATSLARQVESLREERLGAQARMATGALVTEAMKAQAAQVERLLKLDAARDEIERAHALADIYREDAAGR